MLALDRPRGEWATVDREKYEMEHLGKWMRLS